MKRVGLLAGLLVVVLGIGVMAQEPSPEATPLYAPDDLAFLLPRRVGELDLEVTGFQGAEVSEAVRETDDPVGLEALRLILVPLARDPDDLRFAFAVDPAMDQEKPKLIIAIRVDGVTSEALLDHLIRAEAEAEGQEVPPDFIWPTQLIEGRTVLTFNSPEDTSWLAYYPKGEVLFMVVMVDGPTMQEVVAALP